MEGMIAGRTAGDLPGLDMAEQRAWENYLESALRMYAAVDRGLAATHDLTLVDVRLLELLDRSPTGTQRMGDLADELLALPSRVTRRIRRLESMGLVERSSSLEDGRGVLAVITAEGREKIAKALMTYSQDVRTHFLSQLSRPQMAAMGESCRRIVAALRASGAPDKFSHA
ncbi:MarR family winged helix-turn-helix transcriptional regulator [Mycolicibacterium brumae]|uniref:MarR family transcriptional regulator n=1 Tax=Mycolicibacterium brumae TaxID=85968 RepID=A0A2G5PDA1_9MYCO|nr:MarR family transcriptional regulator [Mycolicibacterium brumae]MCV7191821.1 MarR family transcriptional regulator [Mycolicibacterium brumae]PIB76297.1 MarR family transcriptional regulator [Mycolicibacterium brumae]RWA15800.1 hypothetical protein MBRU_09635 [Mycolicibacterium brumae DSM 44177]UWW07127.1 MarR family transcriptional regulator [Mycolicibacterium brumae]